MFEVFDFQGQTSLNKAKFVGKFSSFEEAKKAQSKDAWNRQIYFEGDDGFWGVREDNGKIVKGY